MQRKVFRIEQMERRVSTPASSAPRDTGLARETAPRGLDAVQATVAAMLRELNGLLTEGKERRMTRAAAELGAAVESMENATDKILQSAEVIDDCARALSASQKTDYERGLAQDIQEHATRLYEACNFQDLTGQRIGKVIVMLSAVENCIADLIAHAKDVTAAAVAAPARSDPLLTGPHLEGDEGHARQLDIDKMFA